MLRSQVEKLEPKAEVPAILRVVRQEDSCGAAPRGPDPKPKPSMSFNPDEASGLLGRLRSFLPEMEKSQLELRQRMQEGADVRVEDVEDGERHVQFEVLCLSPESGTEGRSSSDDTDGSSSSESEEAAVVSGPSGCSSNSGALLKKCRKKLIAEVDQ